MLIGICGPIGSGKTLFMTRCLYKEKMQRPDTEIVTNYKLVNIPFRYINTNDLFDIKQQVKNTNIGIDEFHIFLDSRSFMKASNQQLTHFILQTRHLGVNLYFTTQDISQVDIRLRKQLDFLAYCTQTIYQDFFKVKMIDYRDVLNIRTNTFVYNGTPYYQLYDTTEIIDFMNKENGIEEEKIEGDLMDTVKGEIKKEPKVVKYEEVERHDGIKYIRKKKEQKIKPTKVDVSELKKIFDKMPTFAKEKLSPEPIGSVIPESSKYEIKTNVKFIKPKEKTRDEILSDIDNFFKSRE
jgi:hypothetical protein